MPFHVYFGPYLTKYRVYTSVLHTKGLVYYSRHCISTFELRASFDWRAIFPNIQCNSFFVRLLRITYTLIHAESVEAQSRTCPLKGDFSNAVGVTTTDCVWDVTVSRTMLLAWVGDCQNARQDLAESTMQIDLSIYGWPVRCRCLSFSPSWSFSVGLLTFVFTFTSRDIIFLCPWPCAQCHFSCSAPGPTLMHGADLCLGFSRLEHLCEGH